MSFYTDASLVLIPSGYKDQKVYCAKPIDGSADLTFSRASNATRVNSSGLVEKVRTNLLLQSNQFDTIWTNSNTTETSGQSGYDGTNDAWKLDKSAAGGYITQSITLNAMQSFSVYAKAGTSNWVVFLVTGYTAYFDLANGTVGTAGSAPITNIQSVGGGWYRCTLTASASTTSVRIYPAEGDGDTSGTSGNIYIQDAQLETGDIATDYIATTSAAVSVGPVSGLPRLDYSGGASCPSLLLEPLATALNGFSEQLDNAYWTKSAVVTANTTISPDGYQNADTVNDNTTSYLDIRRVISITPNATHTFSFFVKKTTGSLTHYAGIGALLTGASAVVDYGIINTTTGAINRDASSNINSVSYSSESYGDYWRVIMTFTDNQSNPSCTLIIYPAISSNGTSISSSAQGSNVFWGVNLTQSAYATSYIPTLSTAVTRVADEAEKTGISSLIGQTEGTIFIEAEYIDGVQDARFTLSDGGTNNMIFLSAPEPTGGLIKMRMYINVGGVNQVNKFSSTIVTKGTHKYALAYKANDVVMYLDGQNEGSDTSATIPACNQLTVTGGGPTTPEALISTGIKQVILFPTRLTNAQLAELTA